MDLIDSLSKIIPVKYQVISLWIGFVIKWGGEFYSSVKAGGGLKRILTSFWFGEQAPKVILDDYKPEMEAAQKKSSDQIS